VRLEDSKAEYWNQVRGITAFGTWIKVSKLLGLGKMEVIGSNAEHWNQVSKDQSNGARLARIRAMETGCGGSYLDISSAMTTN
jgi:hypothetical protein